MISYFQSIVMGVVEGITEFLPISSTGHLILTTKLLNINQSDFIKSFEIIIQLGAILSVVVLYYKAIFLNYKIFKKIALAFIPTAILGFILYQVVKNVLMSSSIIVIWSLLIGGVLIILFELLYTGIYGKVEPKPDKLQTEIDSISNTQCLILGGFQAIAMIPGVSRSAATIIGGMALGIKRKTIVEFSFLLAVPTMLAASGYDLYKNGAAFSSDQYLVLTLGFFISFIVATIAIKSFLLLIQKHSFIIFGIYRIILALIFLLLIK